MTSPSRPNLELTPVHGDPRAKQTLYDLLKEREPHQRISHKRMPTFEEHCAFVDSKPYRAWYLIIVDGEVCGQIYLSGRNEIGVFLFALRRGSGIGSEAVKMLMERHADVKRFLMNVSPQNPRATAFTCKLNFTHIQNTYEFQR